MLVRWLLALGMALACGASCRAAASEGDLPDLFSVEPMAQHLFLNGLPLEIQVVSIPVAPKQACALIAERWGRARHDALMGCRQVGDWLLVSLYIGSRELTAQLRASPAGSRGYLSKIDLQARPARAPMPRVPMPLGARVRNALQSSGPDGETVQFTVEMPLPPTAALRRLTGYAGQMGWKVSVPSQPMTDAATFELHRGNEFARGLLTRARGGSGLVLVESTASPGRP